MAGLILMDLKTPLLCPLSILMTYWRELSYFLSMRMGREKRAPISDHVNTISQDQVSREDQLRFKLKIDGDQLDDIISYNQLMATLEDNTDTGQLDNGLYKFK